MIRGMAWLMNIGFVPIGGIVAYPASDFGRLSSPEKMIIFWAIFLDSVSLNGEWNST
jgi:hypothetical protein